MPGTQELDQEGTKTLNITVAPAVNGEGLPDEPPPAGGQPAAPPHTCTETQYVYDPANGIFDHGAQVDDDFRRLIPPSSKAERHGLERQLRADGRCLCPLIVWKGHGLLLDGHTRLEICLKWQIPFRVVEIDLPDRELATKWIVAHQADRRNLSVVGQSWVRGLRYVLEKKQPGGTGANQYTKEQRGQRDPSADKTDERLAKEFKVSVATIKRDARLVEALDRLVARWGEQVRQVLLSPDSRCTRPDVKWLDGLGPAEQEQMVGELQEKGKLKRAGQGQKAKAKMSVPREPVRLVPELTCRLTREDLMAVYQGIGNHLVPRQEAPKGGSQSSTTWQPEVGTCS